MISNFFKRKDKTKKQQPQKEDKNPIEMSQITSQKLRVKYFTCKEDKEHQNQVLNMVCVNKDCPTRGLICPLCRLTQHKFHQTLPLKSLLSSLPSSPPELPSVFQQQLSTLQHIHTRILQNLQETVQALAQKFCTVQKHINMEFYTAKIQLMERMQVIANLGSFVDKVMGGHFGTRGEFGADVAKIVGIIDVNVVEKDKDKKHDKNKKKKEEPEIQKVIEIKFLERFGDVCANFKALENAIKKNLVQFEQLSKSQTYPTIAQLKQSSSPPPALAPAPHTPQFSPTFHSGTIQLSQNNTVALQQVTGQGRFVLTTQKPIEYPKIRFKINSLKNWIGVGLGICGTLGTLAYKFEYNNIGHGSYLISSNGYTWSHTESADNVHSVGFGFKQGDVLELEYRKDKDQKNLVICNLTTQKKFQLKVGWSDAEEKDGVFCGNLCSEGDCLEICQSD